jgi:hypothetical protein
MAYLFVVLIRLRLGCNDLSAQVCLHFGSVILEALDFM